MIDVLFIVPPFKYAEMDEAGPVCPHLGAAYIAAFLEKNSYKVKILDAYALKLSPEQIADYLRKNSARIVGIGAVTAEFPSSVELMRVVKKVNKEIVTVLGGPHVCIMPETTARPEIDYIVIGEGEKTMLELADFIIRKKGSISKISGIAYKKEGRLHFNKPRGLIEDLDSLPFPAYHLLPMDRYRPYAIYDMGKKFCSVITSRGCPFACTYCTSSAVFGHRFRTMSPQKVFEMLKMLYDMYGIRHIYFQDDEFTINNDRVFQICDLIIKNNLDIIWECLSRVSDVNDKLLEKMYRAGCRGIVYGAECGYQEGLEKINKKITLEQIRNAVTLSKKHRMHTRASFMMGFPWESEKEIRKTINFATSLNVDIVYFQILTPYPGTKIYNEVKNAGLIVKDDWTNYVQHSIVGTEPLIRTRYLTNKQLQYFNALAFKEFYFRPLYIFKQLLSMRKFSQIKRYVSVGSMLSRNIIKRLLKKH